MHMSRTLGAAVVPGDPEGTDGLQPLCSLCLRLHILGLLLHPLEILRLQPEVRVFPERGGIDARTFLGQLVLELYTCPGSHAGILGKSVCVWDTKPA